MSVLARDIDAYNRALQQYRQRYSSSVREQNAAIKALQSGVRHLVPNTQNPGKYYVARGIDARGNFSFDTRRSGPVTTTDKNLHPVMPAGFSEEAPVEPDASVAQTRAAARPSLAQMEAGLIGQAIRGRGVKQGGAYFPPESLAQQMSRKEVA